MARKIFVSYNFKDKEVSHSVKALLQKHGGKIDGQFVFVTRDVSYEGDAAIDREICRVQSGCDAALFLIGNNSHNSPWINREAQLAKSRDLCIVLARLPGSSGGVPYEFYNSNYSEAEWSEDDLAYYLNQCN
ncbi:TIR domain-containing protein [Marinobacterium stanieri]|uniref:TIR domain-containing protein n=1 Tax=Marinobacterium stanieri TaxID=49186 RepID=UPI000255925D|nr:TIR domain-containing protein [Marinobacterium stanieri]